MCGGAAASTSVVTALPSELGVGRRRRRARGGLSSEGGTNSALYSLRALLSLVAMTHAYRARIWSSQPRVSWLVTEE